MRCVDSIGGCVNGEAVQQPQSQVLNYHTLQSLRMNDEHAFCANLMEPTLEK